MLRLASCCSRCDGQRPRQSIAMHGGVGVAPMRDRLICCADWSGSLRELLKGDSPMYRPCWMRNMRAVPRYCLSSCIE